MGDLVPHPFDAIEQFLQKRLWCCDSIGNGTDTSLLAHSLSPFNGYRPDRPPSSWDLCHGGAGVMVREDLGDDSGDALAGRDVQEFVGTVRI